MKKKCVNCRFYSLRFQNNSNPEEKHCGNYILDTIPVTIWDGIRECELYEDKPVGYDTNDSLEEPNDIKF